MAQAHGLGALSRSVDSGFAHSWALMYDGGTVCGIGCGVRLGGGAVDMTGILPS